MAGNKTFPRRSLPENSSRGENSLLALLETFRPGMSRLASQHRIEIDEVLSEGAIAYFEAEVGFDPTRGNFSRRWWFLLSKRILKQSPRRTDAMAHLDGKALYQEMGTDHD
jgi:hypothetical protein